MNMKCYKRSTVFGAALLLFAGFLRMLGGSPITWAQQPTELPLSWVRPSATLDLPAPKETPTAPAGEPYRFSGADLAYVKMQYAADCGYRPDVAALLQQPLDWDLTGTQPTVLILHTHASESYTKTPGQVYTESTDYRTLDGAYNMLAVGDALTALLTEAGIGVIHDRQIHDYPSYDQAYTNARASVEAYLDAYPSICLVLDLHRDAALNPDGSQYATAATVAGESAAQLMLVVGTDAGGSAHPRWQENLALGVKLQVLLEKTAPGITRPTVLRAQRFNQDLQVGALIVEVGSAGNTQQQALRTVPVLAEAIAELLYGAEYAQNPG